MKIPKLNREKNVSIDITDGVLLISVDGQSICKDQIQKAPDAAVLGKIYGVLVRAGVFI